MLNMLPMNGLLSIGQRIVFHEVGGAAGHKSAGCGKDAQRSANCIHIRVDETFAVQMREGLPGLSSW